MLQVSAYRVEDLGLGPRWAVVRDEQLAILLLLNLKWTWSEDISPDIANGRTFVGTDSRMKRMPSAAM